MADPLTVGSTYSFQATFYKRQADGTLVAWNVQTAQLIFQPPSGAIDSSGNPLVRVTRTATVTGNVATYDNPTTELAAAGRWQRRWVGTDASGTVVDNSLWIGFQVVA